MSVIRIATRYAKSLIELAVEQGKLAQVQADMKVLQHAVQNRDLHLMLKNPVISNDRKAAAMDALFKSQFDSLTMGYLRLLINKNREGYLPEIAAEFGEQYKVLNKITTVRVTTATPMSDAVLEDLRKKILESGATSENLDLQTSVDPELIGGFVLQFDNKRYDASAAHKLDQLRAQFSKNLYVKEF
jgi:F-type H+-transporting ATPase subunit delta